MALMNLQRGLLPRLPCLSPSPVSIITRTLVNRHTFVPAPPVHDPALFQQGVGRFARPVQPIRTAEEFLKAIGRESETKVDKDMPWEEFWKMDGQAMRKAGVAVRDRRCVVHYWFGCLMPDKTFIGLKRGPNAHGSVFLQVYLDVHG